MAAVAQAPSAIPQPSIDSAPRPSSAASNPQQKETAPASSDNKEPAAVTVEEPTPGDEAAEKDAPEEGDTQRPPIRPQGVRSRFDQEPNPFEQSFSHPAPDDNTPPRGTDATSTRHNALPPLSSLTSPAAADPAQFPWLANQSLRAGPLSPAMLTGPQGQNQPNPQRPADESNQPSEGAFEQGSFRTGFTPGTGTGFTPGYNSFINSSLSSLPIPSPNTAAFLNSITNVTPLGEGSEVAQAAQAAAASTTNPTHDHPHPPSAIPPHMQQHAPPHHNAHHSTPPNHPSQPPGVQETITPNTLNALSGVFGDMSRAPPGAHGQPPPGFFPAPIPGQGHPGQPGMPPYVDYAQHNANAASQAANGLFLLSQAHQELSKREEAEGSHSPSSANNTRRGGGRAVSQAAPGSVAGQKRKPEAAPATNGNGNGRAKKGKKGGKAQVVEKETASEDSDDGGSQGRGGEGGKFETEEDKRKNFLERNRQAALKCRQRKKAWLTELQSKVETLTIDNERLQQTVQQMHEEVGRLTAILMQHRDCGLGMPTGFGGHPGGHGHGHVGGRLR
ncbi:hypothetical protein B9479_005166 [Cryptococcus floricola]|uniref:BZIP domain-containing protein n=1 Tax=Cryptococcus floricola TaxID=2591691 RepID=A0A5D3ARV5_9TREE|nr:hypothetical protein B9479_005166 [Cryptococcus floricola]